MKRKRKKVPLKKQLKRLAKKADKALSLYIRAETFLAYSICPLCTVKPIKCCFHFISRRRKILRWDIRNVTGACHTCNYVERHWPDLSRAWLIKVRGVDFYLQLVEESKKSFVPTKEYLEGIITTYTQKLKELENG